MQYFTTKQLLEQVGIKRSALYYWLNNNKIVDPKRYRKSSRIRLWTQEEINAIRDYHNGIVEEKP